MAALSVFGDLIYHRRAKGIRHLRSGTPGPLLLLHVTNKHNVRIVVATHQSELFAVKRPMKIVDTLGFEIGEVVAFRSDYRL